MFDTAKLVAREESPLIIANVHYGTIEERMNWLRPHHTICRDTREVQRAKHGNIFCEATSDILKE